MEIMLNGLPLTHFIIQGLKSATCLGAVCLWIRIFFQCECLPCELIFTVKRYPVSPIFFRKLASCITSTSVGQSQFGFKPRRALKNAVKVFTYNISDSRRLKKKNSSQNTSSVHMQYLRQLQFNAITVMSKLKKFDNWLYSDKIKKVSIWTS